MGMTTATWEKKNAASKDGGEKHSARYSRGMRSGTAKGWRTKRIKRGGKGLPQREGG